MIIVFSNFRVGLRFFFTISIHFESKTKTSASKVPSRGQSSSATKTHGCIKTCDVIVCVNRRSFILITRVFRCKIYLKSRIKMCTKNGRDANFNRKNFLELQAMVEERRTLIRIDEYSSKRMLSSCSFTIAINYSECCIRNSFFETTTKVPLWKWDHGPRQKWFLFSFHFVEMRLLQ